MNELLSKEFQQGNQHTQQALFGREHDLDTVVQMLRSPDCQLVTLTGPGGIGKTRLALQVAEQLGPDFDDEVYIIPLQALSTPQSLVSAVLEQLGSRPQGSGDSTEHLLHVLAQEPVLLVLDNFEHLLDASVLVARIMDAAPQVKLLLTSREVLNLQREWVWPMRGLAYPTPEEADDAYRFPAVRMFDTCGRRVNPSFSWQQELQALIEICALIEGSPLAIQLATGWLKSLSCQAILDELHDGINILSTRMRDVPEQHRSIRAVFDRSWKMLTAEEQAVLMRLCLFRDSFSRDAAQRVAETSLAMLTDLIDKSLLHQDDARRYFFHELFRQYVSEHLRADSVAYGQAERAVTHYYRDFLAARVEDICGRRQQEAVREIAVELQNIRSVMSQLAFTDDPPASRRAVYALSECLHMLGSYREAAAYARDISAQFQAMDESLRIDEHWHLLAETVSGLGWFYIRLGEFDAAESTIQRAQDVHERHNIQPIVGLGTDPRTALSELRAIQGDMAGAEALSEAVYDDSRDRDDPLNGSTALYIPADVAMSRGDLDRARKQVREAVHLSRQAGNSWFLAYCLNQQGHICREQGDYAGAQQRYEESFRIRESFGDPEGQAVALNHLGGLALLQDQYERAAELFQQSLPIYQRIEDRGGLFTAHHGLSLALAACDAFDQAQQHLLQAANIAAEVDLASWWLSLGEAAGEFFAATGEVERGAALVWLAREHPESASSTRSRAENWLQEIDTRPVSLKLDLDHVRRRLADEIAMHIWAHVPTFSSDKQTTDLVESISARELEILRLLEAGMTNQDIADSLVLSVGTVKSHNYNIYGKLGVKNRSQAVRRARELNLL